MLDRLITHLLEPLFWADSCLELGRGLCCRCIDYSMKEVPVFILLHYSMNLFIFLSLTLIYLDSLTLLTKIVHFSIIDGVTKDANLSELSQIMLLIALTQS